MPIDISFTLNEQDLDYFRNLLRTAQQHAAGASEKEIIARAHSKLDNIVVDKLPQYFRDRMGDLETMLAMLGDPQWPLEPQERTDIVSALAYLYDDADAIADDIPVLGMLDDAIVIELVLREMRHEIAAYNEFCLSRSITQRLAGGEISEEEFLAEKRHELFERMRSRMDRHHRSHGESGRLTGFSLS